MDYLYNSNDLGQTVIYLSSIGLETTGQARRLSILYNKLCNVYTKMSGAIF